MDILKENIQENTILPPVLVILTLNEIQMHIYLWRGWGRVTGCAGTFWFINTGYDSNTFVFIGRGGTSMLVSFASPLGLDN